MDRQPHSMPRADWRLRLRLYIACAVLGEIVSTIDSIDPGDWRGLIKLTCKLAFTAAVTWRAFLDRSTPSEEIGATTGPHKPKTP